MSLIAHYKFYDSLKDQQGQYDLSSVGKIGYTVGINDRAIHFDGGNSSSGGYVTNDNIASYLNGKPEASVAFWVKKKSIQYGLFQLSGYNNNNGNLYPYQQADRVYLDTFRTNRLGPIYMDSSTLEWHHIVILQDANRWALYQNGNLVYSVSNDGSPIATDYLGFEIGRNSDGRYADAYFDDFRVYDHALTDEEISLVSGNIKSIASFSKTGFSTPKLDTNKIGNNLYAKGTNGYNDSRSITLNQDEKVSTTLNGLGLVVFNSDLTVASSGVFDIYDSTTARNALVSRMQNLGSNQFAVFATGGTKGIRSTSAIDTEFDRLGSWKWPKSIFLNNKPRLSYAGICHGTHGFVYESLNGSTSNESPSIIETTFDTIDELGENGFGIPLYQDDTEYNSNTTLLDKTIDFDTYLTVSAFMINGTTSTVTLEVEFFNSSNTSLGVSPLNCDSVYLWQKYNALIDIPTNTNRIVVRTVHTGTDARIDTVQVGKHNGFSPVPDDTLFSTKGIYAEKVSQNVHGYELFDTDWYTEQQSEMNAHKGIDFEQGATGNVIWNDRTLSSNTERMITQVSGSTTLNSVSNISLDNKKPYFCAVWVRANTKSEGSVSFGLRGSLLDSNGNSTTDPDMVNIPASDVNSDYKMMYFWILPYTWTNVEVQEFKNSVSGYHESQFNLDHPNNGDVVQMTSSINTTKLFVRDLSNVTTSDVEYALPVVKEVSLLSFSTTKLEALNYTEM